MKIALCLLILLGIAPGVHRASAQWPVTLPGDINQGSKIAVDADNHVYVAGVFRGTIDLEPGEGEALLEDREISNFVARYDASGKHQWSFNLAAAITGLALDRTGNVYIAGLLLRDIIDVDPGIGEKKLYGPGSYNVFVAKYDGQGRLLWAFRIGGEDLAHSPVLSLTDLALDPSGNVVITGLLSGSADFDPGSGRYVLHDMGQPDLYVAKYAPDGAYRWAFLVGDNFYSEMFRPSIATDLEGSVYLAGSLMESADFDPGPGFRILANGLFVAKYDAEGNLGWAFKLGDYYQNTAYGIATDPQNNVHVAGSFYRTVDFDPGAGEAKRTDAHKQTFVATYTSDGEYRRVIQIGSPGAGVGTYGFAGVGTYGFAGVGTYGFYADHRSHLYLTGVLEGVADFDPGEGVAELSSIGRWQQYHAFVAKYDAEGRYVWARDIGPPRDYRSSGLRNFGFDVTADGEANVFVTGFFEGTADFGLDTETPVLREGGNRGAFVARYTSTGALAVRTEERSDLPVDDVDLSVSPNPFQSQATLAVRSTRSQYVRIDLFDLLGRRVRPLYVGIVVGGETRQIEVDGSDLPSGTYFIRLTSNSQAITEQILLVR